MKQASFALHKLDGFISTLYLAVYTDKILVLDGECRNDASRIETYVTKRLNRSMADVKLAVASHPHPDHAGGAQRLRKLFAIPLAAPKHINKWYRGLNPALKKIKHLEHFSTELKVQKRKRQAAMTNS